MTFNQIKSVLELFKKKNPLSFKSVFRGVDLSAHEQRVLRKYFATQKIVIKHLLKGNRLQKEVTFTISPTGIEFLNKIAYYENYDKIINYLIDHVDINIYSIRDICESLEIPFDSIYEAHFLTEGMITRKHHHKGASFYVISFDGRLWMSRTGGHQNQIVKEIMTADNKSLQPKKRTNTHRVRLPKFWNKEHLKLFISHLAKYKEEATKLKSSLALYGVSAFVAHVDIQPSTQWESEMELGLHTCDALLALMHPEFNSSEWTNQEIGFAICRGVPIITVNIGATPGGFTSKFQWIKYEDNIQALTSAIVCCLLENKKTSKEMARCLVDSLKCSDNFDQTKLLLNVISKIDRWSKKLLQVLVEAKENDQVSGRFGAIRTIDLLVKSNTKE